jgi:hypothetical protein
MRAIQIHTLTIQVIHRGKDWSRRGSRVLSDQWWRGIW